MRSRRLIVRHSLLCVSYVLLYLLLSHPEVIFFTRIGFVGWYPATGLVMALLLGVSPRYALLVSFAIALAGKLIYAQPITTFSNTIGALGVAASYGTAAYVLRGPLQIDLGLPRRSDVVRYVLVSSIAAVAATISGVAFLIADHAITWSEYKWSAVNWFLGDAIGLIGVAPFLLVHPLPHIRAWLGSTAFQRESANMRSPATSLRFNTLAEAAAQVLTLLAVLWAMFGREGHRYDHFYLCFIPIIWIAMRHGVRRVVTGLLALNFGIVMAMHFFPPTAFVFVNVAVFMLVLSTVGLIVGSEVSERNRLATDLSQQTTYLDSLIQNSPLGIVVLDRKGRVELANPTFEKLFQYDRRELTSLDIAAMEPCGDGVTDSSQLLSQIFAGDDVRRTVRLRRKGGEILDLALRGVPLLLSGEVRGAYLIYEDISQQIRAAEAQQQHAESLGRLVKELELRTKQMASLNEMGALLECSEGVDEASAVVANSVQRLFPNALSGAVYLFKSSRNLVEAAVRWGKKDSIDPTCPPQACWSLRRGQPHWSGAQGTGIPCRHLREDSPVQCLCVPMVAQGNTLGVLHIEFQNETQSQYDLSPDTLRESEQRLAVSVASQAALSLANLRLRESLREQAIRDPLTQLYNRRFLEESLERELQVAARKRQSLALVFLDLDHFKRFNDSFGHEAGDLVLQALGDRLRDFFRATDICCRYGGEEFAIILPESSAKDAGARADKLRSEVKGLRIQYKKQTLGQITISAGVAAFPEHASTSSDLLKIADQCLYESKASGRDAVTVAVPQNA